MKRSRKNNLLILSIIFTVLLTVTSFERAYAASDSKVMQAYVNGDTVKAYVRNATSTQGAAYQIGNIAAQEPKGYSVSEDKESMRTLIMVDNSLSIPQNSRPLLKESIKSIIDAHGQNEEFRLATFSEDISYLSDTYSADYTVLKNAVDSITHVDQETYLTDVLYKLIDELKAENYAGYTRIIVFSDGVDNKPIGVTREELNKKLDECPYPVYTFGTRTGKNDSELENMFALSRLTGCEYMILEEGDKSEVSQITAKDNSLTVFETEIPEDAKTGGRQSSKLTLSDGAELIFGVEMPFSIKEDAAAQVTTDDSNQGSTVEEDEDIKDVIPEDISESENQNGWVLYAIIAAAVILGAAIVFLIVMLVKKNKGKSGKNKDNGSNAAPIGGENEYQKTVMMDTPPKQESRNTVRMTPGGAADQPKRYRFILTDTADSSRSFRCELVDQINIGRQPDNSIVISDDTTVHGHQAIVSVENDVFKYTDLKSVQNHSSVDGVKISAGIPKLIITNTKITIGRHTYVVSIQKQ